MKAPPVLAVLDRGRETHMTGGASLSRSSSGLKGRGDEVAVSDRPATRLALSLASRPHPADASGQPLDREGGPSTVGLRIDRSEGEGQDVGAWGLLDMQHDVAVGQ